PPTPPPVTIADLERLVAKLALTPDEDIVEDNNYFNINAKRIMYRFWLRTDDEQELALMQWLDILRANRKMQPFIRMALRMSILAAKGYYDQSDEIEDNISLLFDNVNWTKE